jgi:predicted nucleotidyltransferase
MSSSPVDVFLEQFTEWARLQPEVLAVALVGSYARNEAKADSDVDLILVCARPSNYLVDRSWLLTFGEIDRLQQEDYGKLVSVRVWYRAGPEVEYGITDEDWAAIPLDEGSRRVISDGMVVLLERGDILSRHQEADHPPKSRTNKG